MRFQNVVLFGPIAVFTTTVKTSRFEVNSCNMKYLLISTWFCMFFQRHTTIYFYKNVNFKILTFIKNPNVARFSIISFDNISPNDNSLVLLFLYAGYWLDVAGWKLSNLFFNSAEFLNVTIEEFKIWFFRWIIYRYRCTTVSIFFV